MKYLYLFIYALFILNTALINLSFAKESCLEESKSKVKVEAWLSKRYSKDYRDIRKEFLVIGNTKLGLFIYPAENPSRVLAIGRCIPAYVAQFFIKKAIKYSLGTTHLVNQKLISSNWLGMGAPIFGANSMSKITSEQLAILMDDSLDTESFQKIYRYFTVQNKKINIYGLLLDNPRFLSTDH